MKIVTILQSEGWIAEISKLIRLSAVVGISYLAQFQRTR